MEFSYSERKVSLLYLFKLRNEIKIAAFDEFLQIFLRVLLSIQGRLNYLIKLLQWENKIVSRKNIEIELD